MKAIKFYNFQRGVKVDSLKTIFAEVNMVETPMQLTVELDYIDVDLCGRGRYRLAANFSLKIEENSWVRKGRYTISTTTTNLDRVDYLKSDEREDGEIDEIYADFMYDIFNESSGELLSYIEEWYDANSAEITENIALENEE